MSRSLINDLSLPAESTVLVHHNFKSVKELMNFLNKLSPDKVKFE